MAVVAHFCALQCPIEEEDNKKANKNADKLKQSS